MLYIVAWIQPELPVKRPREGINAGESGVKSRVDDPGVSRLKLFCGLREPVFADIFRRRQSEAFSEQPVGIPRGEQRTTSQIGEADFSCLGFCDVVLHALDSQHLFFHIPQLLTDNMIPASAVFLSTFLAA